MVVWVCLRISLPRRHHWRRRQRRELPQRGQRRLQWLWLWLRLLRRLEVAVAASDYINYFFVDHQNP